MATPLTPEQFIALFEGKGWTHGALAAHWKLHRTRIWQIARDPARPPYYDDAVRGLPAVGAALAKKRPGRPRGQVRKAPAAQPVSPGLRYRGFLVVGLIVIVDRYLGEDAPEGARGVVLATRNEAAREDYFVLFEGGAGWWMAPDIIDQHLATTGLVRDELARYRFVSEATARSDWRTLWASAN